MDAGRPYDAVTVLDCTDALGSYASRLFADLGAEVIRIESPDRAAARARACALPGSAAQIAAHCTRAFTNAGKAAVVIDPHSDSDCVRFAALARRAQLVFLERGGPFADRLPWIRGLNAALVMAHVSPFGLTGPHARWKASDLILQAAGGIAWLTGRPGEPPLRLAAGQSSMIASTYAAAVAAVALTDAQATGQGHLIDVSAQECIAHSLQHALQAYDLEGVVASRQGIGTRDAAEAIFHCRDGHMLVASPPGLGPSWHSLVRWIGETGHPAAAILEQPRWMEPRWRKTEEAQHAFRDAFASFIVNFDRKEILHQALVRKIVMAPVSRIGDVLQDAQLTHRHYFVPVAGCVPDRSVRFPGAPYQFSEPVWAIAAPAPELTAAPNPGCARPPEGVQENLGPARRFGDDAPNPGCARPPEGVQENLGPARRFLENPPSGEAASKGGPARIAHTPLDFTFLRGIRIADFCWAGAGPFCTKLFSDFGAQVVKIESRTRVDPVRAGGPHKDGIAGINRSGYFASRNSGKSSVTLDLKTDQGRALALRLIAHSDVVTNNFGPGVMQRLGLGYDDARRAKPDIIHLSMPMYGQDGPLAALLGVGMTISAASGLLWMTAYGRNDPVGPGTHYPDHVANPYHAAFAILAALRHRRNTGRGMRIDLAQVESTINFMGPTIVEFDATGGEPPQIGNRSLTDAPHNLFPCAGDDAWCAIAVQDDQQWQALVNLMERPDLGTDPGLRSASGRLQCAGALEQAVTQWTLRHGAVDLAQRLQAAGVAAALVARPDHLLLHDAHLAARGNWQQVDHPEVGSTTYTSPPFVVDGHRVQLQRPPLMGEHTDQVLRDLLGCSAVEIAAWHAQGVLT